MIEFQICKFDSKEDSEEHGLVLFKTHIHTNLWREYILMTKTHTGNNDFKNIINQEKMSKISSYFVQF